MTVLTLSPVSSAVQAAQAITDKVPDSISGTAKRLYTALSGAALEVMQERDYSIQTTEVTFFCPAESVALSIGVSPRTIYRKLPELARAGLIAAKGHYCTHNGQTRLDGTVWVVRLTPSYGSKARIGFDWLKKSYRSLGADIECGRTAFAQMSESYLKRNKLEIDLSYILAFALNKFPKNPVTFDSDKVDLAAIFDVPQVKKQDRADAIFAAAKSISATLGDSRSTNFYMAVLWNLLRIRDRTGKDYFAALHLMVSRVAAEHGEGAVKAPGALLCHRLKASGFLDPPENMLD